MYVIIFKCIMNRGMTVKILKNLYSEIRQKGNKLVLSSTRSVCSSIAYIKVLL